MGRLHGTILIGCMALATSCINKQPDAASDIQRSAASAPLTTIDAVARELIDGMEIVFLEVQLTSDTGWQQGPFAAKIPSRCALQIEASVLNDLTIRTWGDSCPGIAILAGAPQVLSLNEIRWNLEKNTFSVRSPNWVANGLIAAVSPLLNAILAPRLPRSVKELRASFNLRNPDAILRALVPLLTGQHDPRQLELVANKMRDVKFRYSSRLSRDLKVKLTKAELFLQKGSLTDIAITLSGPHTAPELQNIVIATPQGAIASPEQKPGQHILASIVGVFTVGVITGITIDRLGNYSVLAGSLVTQPKEWRFKYIKNAGQFVYSGPKMASGTINDLIARETPKVLAAFRVFLKQTQPSIPIFLPKDLFRDL